MCTLSTKPLHSHTFSFILTSQRDECNEHIRSAMSRTSPRSGCVPIPLTVNLRCFIARWFWMGWRMGTVSAGWNNLAGSHVCVQVVQLYVPSRTDHHLETNIHYTWIREDLLLILLPNSVIQHILNIYLFSEDIHARTTYQCPLLA